MKRIVCIVFVLAVLAASGAASPALAQEDPSEETPENASENGESEAEVEQDGERDEDAEAAPEQACQPIPGDPLVCIRDYEYDEDTEELVVTVVSDIPTQVVGSDMGTAADHGAGVHEIPQQEYTVTGEQTVRLPAAVNSEGLAKVSIATPRGAATLGIQVDREPVFSWSPTWTDLYVIIMLTVAGTLVGALLALIHVKRQDESDLERWF